MPQDGQEKTKPTIEIQEPGAYIFHPNRRNEDDRLKRRQIHKNYSSRIEELERLEESERQNLKLQSDNKKEEIIRLHAEALVNAKEEKEKREKLAKEARERIISETPLPSLALILLEADQPINGEQDENKYRFTFTRVDRDKLHEIKTNKKQMLFASNTPSPEFQNIQEKLGAFDVEFSNIENNLGNNIDDIRANVIRLKTLFEEIKQNCETYKDKHKGFRWTPTGRARKALVIETERIISEKIQTLQEAFQRVDTRNQQQQDKRNEGLAKVETDEKIKNDHLTSIENINAEKDNQVQLLENETITKDAAISTDIQKKKQAALEERDNKLKVLANLNVESRVPLQYTMKDMLSDRQKSIMASVQFAKLLFDDKYNPFKCYYTKLEQADSTENAIGDTSFKKTAHNLAVLKDKFTNGTPKLNMTYSPDALMTMSNLSFFDKIMRYQRKPNDVYVDYAIMDKEHNQLNEEDVAKMSENDIKEKGIFCVVKNLRAEMEPASLKYPFSQFSVAQFSIREGAFINQNTLERFMNLDKNMVKTSITTISEEEKDQFYSAIEETRKNITKRYNAYNLSFPYGNQLNVVSEKAFMKGLSHGLVENMVMNDSIRSNKPYFTADDDHYDMDLLVNEGKLSLAEGKDIRLLSKEIEGLKEQIIPKERFTLLNPSKFDNRLEDILKNDGESEVGKLIKDIMNLRSMSIDEAFSSFRFAYSEGVLEYAKHSNSKGKKLLTRNILYDEKATALYVRVNRYLKNHADDINKPGTYAELLSQWKEENFPEGRLVVPKDPNAKYIDTTLPISDEKRKQGYLETEDELLFSAQILSGYKPYNQDEITNQYDLRNQKVIMLDVPEEPLFTKKANISEIRQGSNGDCYFLATLCSMINENPQSIEDMMKDNGDGTVTCRFYNDQYNPIYVRVKKSLPVSLNGNLPGDIACAANSEKVPLWVHILEKAYALSGLNEYTFDKEKVADKIRNSIGKRENWKTKLTDDQVIRKFVQKRFPNLNTAEEIESCAKRILNSGYISISGGHAEITLKNFTGKPTENLQIKTSSGLNVMEMLSDLGSQMGDLVLNPGDYTDKQLLNKIGQQAFNILYNERVYTAYDQNGEKYNGIKHISVEKLQEAIIHASNRLAKDEPDKKRAGEIVDFAKKLNKDMSEFQMTDKPQKYVLRFNKPGSYSKEARELYNKIKDARNDHRAVACTFRKMTETKSKDNKELKLNLAAKKMQSGGAVLNHAFSITDVIQKDGLLYVQLRNPWGSGERVKRERQIINDSGKEMVKTNYYQGVTSNKDGGIEGGIFEMELNSFVKHIDTLQYVKKDGPVINDAAPVKEDNSIRIEEGGKLI